MKLGTSIVLVLALAGCGKTDSASSAEKGGRGSDVYAAKTAKLTVERLAFEAYPTWAAAHPDAACPGKLTDLTEQVDEKTTKDPWGTELRMFCGANLPAGARGLAIQSAGPDHAFDTADDVKTW